MDEVSDNLTQVNYKPGGGAGRGFAPTKFDLVIHYNQVSEQEKEMVKFEILPSDYQALTNFDTTRSY